MRGRAEREMGPPVELAMDVVRKRWKASVLLELGDGNLRFGELHARLPVVAHKVLTEVLRELAVDGLVTRNPLPGRTRHVQYALTDEGATLLPIMRALRAWRTDRAS